MRLRQCVFVARELEPAAGRLRAAAGLGEPYADPGVGAFGLRNAVMALGTQFVEVVAPVREGTAAGRHLERRGEGGYMVLVQVDDVAAVRARAAALGVRTVWSIDLPDISASHLHPGDAGGTILSVDEPRPPGSWRWGGPAWTGRAGDGPPGALGEVSIEVPDPVPVAARWAELLGLPAPPDASLELAPGGERIAFAAGDRGLVEVVAEVPGRGPAELRIGAARLSVL